MLQPLRDLQQHRHEPLLPGRPGRRHERANGACLFTALKRHATHFVDFHTGYTSDTRWALYADLGAKVSRVGRTMAEAFGYENTGSALDCVGNRDQFGSWKADVQPPSPWPDQLWALKVDIAVVEVMCSHLALPNAEASLVQMLGRRRRHLIVHEIGAVWAGVLAAPASCGPIGPRHHHGKW